MAEQTTQTNPQDPPASDFHLYRLTEITEPGALDPGRYIATRGDRVLLDAELDEPTQPRDLIPLVREMGEAARG